MAESGGGIRGRVQEGIVGSASFLGIFVVSGKNALDAMPTHNESGLWQAWNLADGSIMVQPLDVDQTPCGNIYTITGSEFALLLKPLDSFNDMVEQFQAQDPAETYESNIQGTPSPSAQTTKGNRPSIAPDLLRYADALESGSDTPSPLFPFASPSQNANAAQTSILTDNSRQIRANSPNLLEIWHNAYIKVTENTKKFSPGNAGPRMVMDLEAPSFEQAFEILDPTEQMPIPRSGIGYSVGQKRNNESGPGSLSAQMQNFSGSQAETLPPRTDGQTERKMDITSSPVALKQMQGAEQEMREQFALLLAEVQEDMPNPTLEDAITRLLTQDIPSSSRHRFMFTEFGMALRRKKKIKLAFLCHMRALYFAPEDENVLFNVARTEYELGSIKKAEERLNQALSVNPGFSAAANFLAFLRALNPAGN
ncbi:MAG: hypothetical protein LBN33_02615 [Desulfovibrio sp.]|jgi:tetratricopeptide (TPR) repeat protein|nr:hypothetical protein [Desulfovibrio sp.]